MTRELLCPQSQRVRPPRPGVGRRVSERRPRSSTLERHQPRRFEDWSRRPVHRNRLRLKLRGVRRSQRAKREGIQILSRDASRTPKQLGTRPSSRRSALQMLCMQRSIERTRRKLRSRTPARASAWRPGQQRGTSAITGSCSRKENTQCVLYSDPGQRVLYAFFTRFF